MLSDGRLAYCLVLKHPGEIMRDEDGVKSSTECWIYI